MSSNQYTKPSSLLGYCWLKDQTSSLEEFRRKFINLTAREPNCLLETASYVIYLLLSPTTKTGSDATGQVKVVLHGEIYEAVEDQAAYLAEKFALGGDTCAKDINGSCAILLVDQQKDRVLLITDRINSRRIFCSRYAGGYCISSKLLLQPWQSFQLDHTGIAWYLSNGFPGNNRTLLDGVSILARACIHELTKEGFQATKYWIYQFNSSGTQVNQEQLSAELSQLLIQAVQRRLYDHPDLFLSLSAGYDATGILGILGFDLQIPHVHCFSYLHGKPEPGTDEYLAMLMAKSVGYSHDMVEGYTSNLIDHILTNAEMGQGVSNHCDEVDAWKTLAPRFSSVERPVLLVGDVSWMFRDYSLQNWSDVLAMVRINSFEVLSWLAPSLPNKTYESFKNGLAEDINQIISSCLPINHWHDGKDLLFFEGWIVNKLMPWRENFAGQFVTVRNPFLDNEILDFMTTIPTSLRRGKRLYRQTITKMYPQLFNFPRATHCSYKLDLKPEFKQHVIAIQDMIKNQESRLDEIIPPEFLLKLLTEVLANNNSLPSLKSKVLNQIPKSLQKSIKCKVSPYLSPGKPSQVNPATLLMRLMIMRTVLSKGNELAI